MINVWQQAERAERGEARRRSGACERRAPHRAVNAACFAACRGRLEESWRIPLRPEAALAFEMGSRQPANSLIST